MENIPNEFRCPISMELMTDPVLCEDGQTYDRRSIQEWLERSQTSPLTRQPLNPNALRPNLALKASIDRWKQQQSQNNKEHQIINPVSTYPYQYQPSYQPAPYIYPPPAPPVTQSAYATTTIVPVQPYRPSQIQPQQVAVVLNTEQKKKAMRIICILLALILIIIILSSIISGNRNRTSRYADDDDT